MLLNNWKGFAPDILGGKDSLPWKELDGRVARIIADALTHLDDKTSKQIVNMAKGMATLFKKEWPKVVKDVPGNAALVSHQTALIACAQRTEIPIADTLPDLLAVLSLMLVSESRGRKGNPRSVALLDATGAISTVIAMEAFSENAPEITRKLFTRYGATLARKGADAKHGPNRKAKEFALKEAEKQWAEKPTLTAHALANEIYRAVDDFAQGVGFIPKEENMERNIYDWIRAACKDGTLTKP